MVHSGRLYSAKMAIIGISHSTWSSYSIILMFLPLSSEIDVSSQGTRADLCDCLNPPSTMEVMLCDFQIWVIQIFLKKECIKRGGYIIMGHRKMESRKCFGDISPALSKENRQEIWQIHFLLTGEVEPVLKQGRLVGPHHGSVKPSVKHFTSLSVSVSAEKHVSCQLNNPRLCHWRRTDLGRRIS